MTSPSEFDAYQSVLAMLKQMRDEAEDVAVSTGTTPTAEEALDAAIERVEDMLNGGGAKPQRRDGPR